MWDEMLLSRSKVPTDHVLESLHKLRIRESDHVKTVLELYELETHQKISKPDYQKLKTLVLEKHRAKKSDHETFKPETRGTKHEQF